MEFLNVGGGELLIIILLALVLFSPEDILKLMRSIGNYARTARQMWTNVTKSLQEDYIPEDVKDVVKETADSVKEARATMTDVQQQFSKITTSVESEVSEATQLAEDKVSEAVDTVNETKVSEEDIIKATPDADKVDEESVERTGNEPLLGDQVQPEEIESITLTETNESDFEVVIQSDVETDLDEHLIATQAIIESILHPPIKEELLEEDTSDKPDPDTNLSASITEEMPVDTPEIFEQDEPTSVTKEAMKDTQEYKRPISAALVNAKLAKVTENSLKDDSSDS